MINIQNQISGSNIARTMVESWMPQHMLGLTCLIK